MQTRANHDAEVFWCHPCAHTLHQILHFDLDIQYSLKITKSQELVKFNRDDPPRSPWGGKLKDLQSATPRADGPRGRGGTSTLSPGAACDLAGTHLAGFWMLDLGLTHGFTHRTPGGMYWLSS